MREEGIFVNGTEGRLVTALEETEQFCRERKIPVNDALRLRLLTEELIGMLGGITADDYKAMFYIDGNRRECRLRLLGHVQMTAERRQELLDAASSGKNAAAKGFMGKIREMITVSMLNWNDAMKIHDEAGDPVMEFADAGIDQTISAPESRTWSLSNYRSNMGAQSDGAENGIPHRGWDELEKSIIAKLADDVTVGIENDTVEIIVVKKLSAAESAVQEEEEEYEEDMEPAEEELPGEDYILFINACVREESRTKRLADHLLSQLSGSIREVRLNELDFPVVDEDFLIRRNEYLNSYDYSDPMFDLAKEFADARTVVIAAPYWDLSFPAVLKQYIEQINVLGITFSYSGNGQPRGFCRADKLYYVTTAGGTLDETYGFGYVRALTEEFYGIPEVRLISAEGLDLDYADAEDILQQAIENIRL